MNTQTRIYTKLDNARSGVIHLNGTPLENMHTAGEWLDGAGHKYGIVLGPDFNGSRHFVTTDSNDNQVSRGVVTLTGFTPKPGKEHETPLYRGNLGELAIVMYPIPDRLQVRIDKPRPAKQPKPEVLDFVNTPPAGTQKLGQVEATAAKAIAAEHKAAIADDFGDDDMPF